MSRRRSVKRVTPEARVTRQIRDVLHLCRVWHWKQFQTLGSPPGIADILGIRRVRVQDLVDAGVEEVGVFFAVEVKAPRGKLSRAQEEFLDAVRREGGIALEARDVETVQEALGLSVTTFGSRGSTMKPK
jgi:hypothetical protein